MAGLGVRGRPGARAQVQGVHPQEWWFGTLPDWQVWSILLDVPGACLGGALLGVLTGRWLRFRGASAVAVVALIVVSLLGQIPLFVDQHLRVAASGCHGRGHHPLTGATAANIDVAVVRVAAETVTPSGQLLVEIVEHEIA